MEREQHPQGGTGRPVVRRSRYRSDGDEAQIAQEEVRLPAAPVVVVKSGLPGWAIALIVVFVVGFLAAIAIPSFMKTRQQARLHTCLNNLRLLDMAKEQAAMDKALDTGAIVSGEALSEYLKGGIGGIQCPDGGVYTLNPIGDEPVCSRHGSLSDVRYR